ncbi:MAG TPA: outer membrane beta-barrel protein [Sphingomonas sp.]|jgi:opacity protein-like surface antigen
MKFGIGAAVAVTCAALASPATAQDASDNGRGVYLSLQGGVAAVNDVDIGYFDEGGVFGGTGATDTADFEVDLKNAFAFGGALGYDFGTVRADVELNYSRNRVKALTLQRINGAAVTLSAADRQEVCDYLEADSCGGSGATFDVDGARLRQLSALANLWLDIPTGSVVTPYVGGGLGVAGYEYEGEGKARFAWQLGAGVAAAVSPNVSITADYRRRQTNGSTITDEEFPEAGLRIGKVRTNLFTVGLRFRF